LIPVATNGTHASETSAALTAQEHAAADWLRGRLADGPESEQLVGLDGEHAGYSWATLLRAKDHLRIRSTKADDVWYWRLPTCERWERERYPGEEDDDDDRPF
jgi:hypothetical protein